MKTCEIQNHCHDMFSSFLCFGFFYGFKGTCPDVCHMKMETAEQWSLSVENIVCCFHCGFKSRESRQCTPSWNGFF